jgi:cytochrome c5
MMKKNFPLILSAVCMTPLVVALSQHQAFAASGQQTYSQVCSSCHASGAMGAPKFGSKADWAPRIKQGKQTLYQNAITGIGAMPPKGGQPSLSDADVKAAVDYMVAEVSGGSGGQQQATKGGGTSKSGSSKKAPAQPDPKVGRLKADTCMGCHGIPGYMMVYPTYPVPKLGGQHPEYIVSALQQYKTGERKNSTMQAQALALSNKDMQDIAAYFSSLAPEAPEFGGGGGGQQQATTGGGNKVAEASPKAQMGPGIKVAAARGASPENESTYQAMCSTCHSSGALGAPKITDKAAWQPRIAQGPKVLYSSALNGIGAMPAKGGHPQLSDEQVKAAVDYMVGAVK